MHAAIRRLIGSGAPVYAECGGFMYLTDAIADEAGCCWPMVGIFPTVARMRTRMTRLGYTEVEMASGERARGHQFRYSEIDPLPDTIERPYADGYRIGEVIASYTHLHFLSCPGFARAFIDRCAASRRKERP
jgi:cobyrinic acid a,c-diamide synthase